MNEGLICPECMKKFISLKSLQDHFQQIHIEQSDNSDESSRFLGILRKAKKTFEDILDNEPIIPNQSNANIFKINSEIDTQDSDHYISYAFYEEPNIRPQPIGITVNKTEEFVKMRRSKLLTSAVEMSSLIIKLEKLISYQLNGSFRDRRVFEQSVVDWVRDDLVPMCPTCGGKFGLNLPLNISNGNTVSLISCNNEIKVKKQSKLKVALLNFIDSEMDSLMIRKKHHCRICGGIICAPCSYMLTVSEANRLVSGVNSRYELRQSLLEESAGLLWNEDSQTSLDSIKSKIKSNAEYSIRCCSDCKVQIETKWNQLERRVSDNEIVDLYKELSDRMNRVAKLIPEYDKMCQSLCMGEIEYSYQRTKELRSDIVIIFQEIDSIGNKFKSKISTNGNERETTLFKSIYRNCFLFLQNNFATLKQLPKEEMVEEIAKNRLLRIRKKVDDEKKLQKSRSMEQMKVIVQTDQPDAGWAPTVSNHVKIVNARRNTNPFECDDFTENSEENTQLTALALQIENVRQYIEMARQAKKDQEVKILQLNMMDLKSEYEALQKSLRI